MERKKRLMFGLAILAIALLGIGTAHLLSVESSAVKPQLRAIQDKVRKGETLLAIFAKHGLDIRELLAMREVAAKIYPLRKVHTGQDYTVTVDGQNRVNSFVYRINRDSVLKIKKVSTGFEAQTASIPYEKKLFTISGTIEDSLISSLGQDREHLLLALQLSDIFAWDIDFAVDLRKGDSYRIIVEGLLNNGEFSRYGNIVAAEFINEGKSFRAFRFGHDNRADYYDDEGRALKKAFLKAPLNFRRISSHFSGARLHPILKISRPHNGIDYAAASGTPVSAIGDGTVVHAGWRGAYGKMVIIRHPNGWETGYGHLSGISPGIKKGRSVSQGQVIGNVGATGLATGPHLHYEVRINSRCVNPLKIKMSGGRSISPQQLTAFRKFRDRLAFSLSNIQICRQAVQNDAVIDRETIYY